MRHRILRAAGTGVLVLSFIAWHLPASAGPLLAFRPGPIEHPLAIATADFDRDGWDDIAIADLRSGTIQILINHKDGTFTPIGSGPLDVGAATFSTPSSEPLALVAVDLNPSDVDSDGVPNASDNCPNFPNPIDSTGTQPDINHDGVGDACERGTDTDHNGTIDVPIDTDGDGVLDYDPVTHKVDNCPFLVNPGQEDTETAAGPDGICGTSDDNPLLYGKDGLCGTPDDRIGDGVGDACEKSPDLVILTSSVGFGSIFGEARVRVNDGAGNFGSRPSFLTGVGPIAILLGDINKDAFPDLLISDPEAAAVQVLPGAADGQFGTQAFLAPGAGTGPEGLALADVDHDGALDLVVAERTVDKLAVFHNDGTHFPSITPTATIALTAGARPTVLLSGRLDADAVDDVVVLNQGELTCLDGPKAGVECSSDADCADTAAPSVVHSCQGGDGSIEVFRGAGAGAPAPLVPGQTIALGPGHRPRGGLLLDLDGNGTIDLAVADFTGGTVEMFSGVGDGTFVPGPMPTLTVTGQTFAPTPAALAPLRIDPSSPNGPDLAILDTANNRIDLWKNTGGLTFALAPTSPASPWRDTSILSVFGADSIVATDILMVQRHSARIDVLSGLGNGAFRPTPPVVLKGPGSTIGSPGPSVTAMQVGDLRYDLLPDMALLDEGGTVTIVTNERSGGLLERSTIDVGGGTTSLTANSILSGLDDIDRDGVPNLVDDCPTIYNPPCLSLTQPGCTVVNDCTTAGDIPPVCDPANPATLDPTTKQCDGDQNGIGDACQVLSSNCTAIDSDFDLKSDYDPSALPITGGGVDFDHDTIPDFRDNCPTIANTNQADANGNGIGDACEVLNNGNPVDPDHDGVVTFNPVTLERDNCPNTYNPGQEDNDHDGVGNACALAAALDNCPTQINTNQEDDDGDGVGNVCEVAPIDLMTVNPSLGTVSLYLGDGTGALHPSTVSPLSGLQQPTAAVSGHFVVTCANTIGFCRSRTTLDIAVAEQVDPAVQGDDRVTLFAGDEAGSGAFAPETGSLPTPLSGNPSALLVAEVQRVCGNPLDPVDPSLRFPITNNTTDVLAVVEQDSSSIEVLVPSNAHLIDPTRSALVHPPAQPGPIPVPAPLRAVVFSDINQDGLKDLVTLSSPAGGPSRVTIYLAMGNGLFYTDDTFNPAPIPGEMTLMGVDNVNLVSDNFDPDVVLLGANDQSPIVMLNVMGERADIDGSGRVDGLDLALLAASFGANRGEDFTLLPNATLLQTSDPPVTRRVIAGGALVPGQELPDPAGFCDGVFTPQRLAYGLAADINLDGVVDGKDLALLAALFGESP